MNGRKAKALRREVYGDGSRRPKRQYVRGRNGGIENAPNSLRARYQSAKKVGGSN